MTHPAQPHKAAMLVHERLCFGAAPGHGNVALVIENGPAVLAARQAFASDNQRTCVFLTVPAHPGAPYQADYFYPHARSPLCLHATLAAAAILYPRGERAVVSAMRGQQIKLLQDARGTFAGVRRQAVAPIGVDAALASGLLGEPRLQLASPPLMSSIGSPKLLIEVADSAALHALRPPLERIVEWGRENGVSGCYVYCSIGDGVYEGRNFNHLDPAMEDCATGVAAGALSAWLQRALSMLQGRALGNPCRIITALDGSDIYVGGAIEERLR